MQKWEHLILETGFQRGAEILINDEANRQHRFLQAAG